MRLSIARTVGEHAVPCVAELTPHGDAMTRLSLRRVGLGCPCHSAPLRMGPWIYLPRFETAGRCC